MCFAENWSQNTTENLAIKSPILTLKLSKEEVFHCLRKTGLDWLVSIHHRIIQKIVAHARLTMSFQFWISLHWEDFQHIETCSKMTLWAVQCSRSLITASIPRGWSMCLSQNYQVPWPLPWAETHLPMFCTLLLLFKTLLAILQRCEHTLSAQHNP